VALLLSARTRAAPNPQPPSIAPRTVEIDDPGGRFLARFFARLDVLRAASRDRIEIVRVTHLGDSHVTSDVLTGELRRKLQGELGDGGPGIVLLGKPWPTYYHQEVKTGSDGGWVAERYLSKASRGHPLPRDDLFGIAGVSVSTNAPTGTWLELRRSEASISRLELFFLRQPRGGLIEISIEGSVAKRIVTTASDTTGDSSVVELPPGTRRVEVRAFGGEVRLFGADLRSGRSGVVYDALGINGAKATSLLKGNEALLAAQLARIEPDLLVLAYGSNEVDIDRLTREAFAKSFDPVLERMRRLAPRAACLVLGPPDRARWRRHSREIPASLDFIVEEQRRLALERGCAFWDQRAAMGGSGSILAWVAADPPLASRDYVHLTAAGYRLVATALHDALARARCLHRPCGAAATPAAPAPGR
jgi:lysophospholipase L1-like esterase